MLKHGVPKPKLELIRQARLAIEADSNLRMQQPAPGGHQFHIRWYHDPARRLVFGDENLLRLGEIGSSTQQSADFPFKGFLFA